MHEQGEAAMGLRLPELVVLALIALIIYRSMSRRGAVSVPRQPGEATYHKASEHPIPRGFQVYEQFVGVRGVTFRQDNVKAFLSAAQPALTFEREPTNTHDCTSACPSTSSPGSSRRS